MKRIKPYRGPYVRPLQTGMTRGELPVIPENLAEQAVETVTMDPTGEAESSPMW